MINKIKYKILSIFPLIGLYWAVLFLKYTVLNFENNDAAWLVLFLILSAVGFNLIVFNKLWKK